MNEEDSRQPNLLLSTYNYKESKYRTPENKELYDRHIPAAMEQLLEYLRRQEEKQESENELVLSLLEQLRQKDIQIAEKDKQIAQLMEQAKNYQVLLQAQQVLSLPAPKRSFFKRLFGIHEEKE